MENQLREMKNDVNIVGTLKEVNIEVKPNKKDPNVKQAMGNIVVIVEKDGKVNEHRVEIFAKETSKLYKGYLTVRDEYQPADTVGKENATRVNIVGNLQMNDYIPQDGELRSFNRIRGVFINRLEGANAEKPDQALAQLELLVRSVEEATNKQGETTGEYKMKAYSVGYGSSILDIKDVIIGEDLADTVTEQYDQGATGMLTFEMNNYVEIEENNDKDPIDDSAGFGVQVDLGNESKNYVRELRVIGGVPAYFDERALEEDDIKEVTRLRKLQLQEVKDRAQAPSTPPQTQGGFGVNGTQGQQKNEDPFADNGDGPIDISDDDLPF